MAMKLHDDIDLGPEDNWSLKNCGWRWFCRSAGTLPSWAGSISRSADSAPKPSPATNPSTLPVSVAGQWPEAFAPAPTRRVPNLSRRCTPSA